MELSEKEGKKEVSIVRRRYGGEEREEGSRDSVY